MLHDWALQVLAGVATAAVLAIAQRCFALVRHVKTLVSHIAGMQTTIARLETTVAGLEPLSQTVETLDDAVCALWRAVWLSRPQNRPQPIGRERPRG